MINSVSSDLAQLQTQQSYTDLSSLQSIRKNGAENQDLALKQVAQQFESMFVQMMLKSMRSANDVFAKDNPLNSFEMKHHQDMYDKQLSLSLSSSNKIGLADAFYRQMKSQYIPEANTVKSQSSNSLKRQDVGDPYWRDNVLSSAQVFLKDKVAVKNIDSPEAFVTSLAPYAKAAAKALGIDDYRILIAQSALETGWGKYVIEDQQGNSSLNLFNIKADKRWDGKSVNVSTLEYVEGIAQKENASFRRYSSIAESFSDYQRFLNQPRYANALKSENAEDYIKELQRAGYATDPKYAEKVVSVMNDIISNHSTF